MTNIPKTKPSFEIVLEPWQYQQQQHHTPILINSIQIPVVSGFDPHFDKQFQCQYLSRKKNTKNVQKSTQEADDRRRSREFKRIGIVDYVRKNQQKLGQLNFIHNYSALMNDDLQNFVPINAHIQQNLVIRRPSINTTYIGYYDEEPFFIDNPSKIKSHKQHTKSRSSDSKRPKTSDFTGSTNHTRQNSRKKLYNVQLSEMQNQIYDRAAPSINGHHLQKVLKIKQKLRQKLKRISQKKDEQRSLYINSTMKIQQQKQKTKEIQHTHNNKSLLQKNSSNQIKARKINVKNTIEKPEVKHVDKWKEFIRMQNQKKQKQKNNSKQKEKKQQNHFFNLTGFSSKSSYTNYKIQKSFRVIGGSIYK